MRLESRADYQRIIDSFVFWNHRIGDSPHVTISVEGTPDGSQQLGPLQRKVSALSGEPTHQEWALASFLHDVFSYISSEVSVEKCARLTQFLSRMRQSQGLSVTDVANDLQVDPVAMAMWERGTTAPPWPLFLRWCQVFGYHCPPATAIVRVRDVSSRLLETLKHSPEELHRLEPRDFEALVANRLDRMGFNVCLTGKTNSRDGGIDMIAVPKTMNIGSFAIAVQAKHHHDHLKTGRDAVDRLASWNGPFRLGLLVTNTAFSRHALWAAAQERNKHFLRLPDFSDLKRWLQDLYGSPEDWREIPTSIELAPGIVISIPKLPDYF